MALIDMAWSGHGVRWRGVAWRGVAWRDVVSCGMAWHTYVFTGKVGRYPHGNVL